MKVNKTKIPGLLIIEPKAFGDDRGYFYESFQAERYAEHGVNLPFVQDNISKSSRGVLRGLHHQKENTQGKLVWVTDGEVFDVILDIRRDSPTFGEWLSIILDTKKHRQVYVPPGCAHGFCVLSESATFMYKCTDYYNPQSEMSVQWDDPDLAIDWPIKNNVTLSEKDKNGRALKTIPENELPIFES